MSREARYAVGDVARLTGISADTIRVWERRHGAVAPERSPGGTRRYGDGEVARLRLLKAAIDGGRRIGDVVELCDEELARLEASDTSIRVLAGIEETLDALEQLDAIRAQAGVEEQLAALGSLRFAQEFAGPLATAIGDRWESDRFCIASEHLGSALLRSAMGSALKSIQVPTTGAKVLFSTLPGEPHELGLLISAITAASAGVNVVYLGAELPADEIVRAAAMSQARAVALSVVEIGGATTAKATARLRKALRSDVELWIGGRAAKGLRERKGVERIDSMRGLEEQVERLRLSQESSQ